MNPKPLLQLKAFLTPLPPAERGVFAAKCGTTAGYLRNVMYGDRPCPPGLAVRIEQESSLAVRRWHLRPTDWFSLWPELVDVDDAPKRRTKTKQAA